MLYFKVRNFEQFQHYKHRNPPWIRLYATLLRDRRFFRLDDASKWVIVGLFLLASQHENRIPFDEEWIAKELSLTTTPNWKALIDSEFIIPIDCDASGLLASCKRTSSQSRADNSETEAEILSLPPKAAEVSGRVAGESWNSGGLKAATLKESLREASEIFKHWNTQPATMHHRAIDGQEKAIVLSLRKFSPAEIRRAIERYSQVRANAQGRYRELYAWTLGEFLSRREHYNLTRFNAEDWEAPFLLNGLPQTKRAKQESVDWDALRESYGPDALAAKSGGGGEPRN